MAAPILKLDVYQFLSRTHVCVEQLRVYAYGIPSKCDDILRNKW